MKWVRAAAIPAVLYPIVGVTFASPLHASSTHAAVIAWRLAAWLVSAAAFASHLGYEHRQLRNSPFRAAVHCAAAVAVGAFLLAVWVNIRGYWMPSAHHSRLAPLALVVFPVVTGVPAFLVGLAALTLVVRFRNRSS